MNTSDPELRFFPLMGFRPAVQVVQRDQYGDKPVWIVADDSPFLSKYEGKFDVWAPVESIEGVMLDLIREAALPAPAPTLPGVPGVPGVFVPGGPPAWPPCFLCGPDNPDEPGTPGVVIVPPDGPDLPPIAAVPLPGAGGMMIGLLCLCVIALLFRHSDDLETIR